MQEQAFSWKFHWTTRDAWEAMLADCAAAQKTIDLEQYLFDNGDIGRRFIEVLTKKAREGVRVRILLDAAGSFGIFFSGFPDELMSAGNVQVRFFNPISPWRIGNALSWYFRDHRRILVVDGTVGYIGGVCLRDAMASSRETQLRIVDPVVGEMTEAFERIWQSVETRGIKNFPKPTARGSKFNFLTNSPRYHRRFVYHALRHAIRNADASVYLTSPYFVPDARLFRALRRAARRGVDVRLLLSGSSDHRLVDVASNSYYERAFRAGIRVFLYEGGRLHAKTGVIDERWATVGTANLDNLSLRFNYEGNIVTTDTAMIAELGRQFREDLTHAQEIVHKEWRLRPLSQKFLEKLLWPLHRFL